MPFVCRERLETDPVVMSGNVKVVANLEEEWKHTVLPWSLDIKK
jgi:hypothetical protein